MRVFLTGATGFIGSAIVRELQGAGHQVLGLTRSDEGAKALLAAGAQVHRGNVEDLASLRSGAAQAEGVIHTAFNHDFSRFLQNCEDDRRAIAALGEAIAGSDRPLVITSGSAIVATPGRLSLETDAPPAGSAKHPRAASEEAAGLLSAQGLRVSSVRLSPSVHDTVKAGLTTYLIAVAKEKGISAYVGSGANRWPAVHRLDAATLFRLALDKGTSGARYNGVDEEGIALKDIAQGIGGYLKVPVVSLTPEQAAAHFGWLAMFISLDCPASSALTRQALGWQPMHRGLLADLQAM